VNHRLAAIEDRCARALRRHLVAGDELTLHEAYEFGRSALDEGVGVMDMALILWHAVHAQRSDFARDPQRARRVEAFLVESLSPFEMAHRGACEASTSLRRLDERREEHVRRVARELHDQAGQLLATVYLSLDGLRSHLAPEGEQDFARLVEILDQVEVEIRRVAHELRPLILDDLGLVPALRFLGEGVARRSGVAIDVSGSTDGRLPPRVETELYRTAQEALSNVARHSKASRAVIEVCRTERELRFRIHDDGCGFDPAHAPSPDKPRGLGLVGIRERLAPLGGAMEVHSGPREGTELLIRIPLEVSHAYAHPAGG
jgi:signal transduction histidine kinase